VLVATALIIERRFNLPLIVSELGASSRNRRTTGKPRNHNGTFFNGS
jgi:hypothetical protein